MKIYAFHLLNDYSGSPKVLMQLCKGWTKNNVEVELFTSSGREGFLSNIEAVKTNFFWYRFSQNKFVRLFSLFFSQSLLFVKLLFKVKKKDIIYINTVLPFGAGILGKLKGCRVIYHIHETSIKPKVFKRFLFGIAKWTAKDVIYVSNFLAEEEQFKKAKTHILYNAIENIFLEKAKEKRISLPKSNPKNVLMVCSLKAYKGVNEFVKLAQYNPNFEFKLVMNAQKKDIDTYFTNFQIPSNLTLFPTQTNLHTFYLWADVILNLSRPDGWVETFGLTIIEGMSYGLPAIVPPVGGIAEIVEEGKNGFKVDSRNTDLLNQTLQKLLNNSDLYNQMAQNCQEKIKEFSEETFLEKSLSILEEQA